MPKQINEAAVGEPQVITLTETAAYLRVRASRIYRLLKAGALPAFKQDTQGRRTS
jgi:excisionase family DNA binding protein